MGDHGDVRSWQSEVRLDQVRVSILSDHNVPLPSYAESFKSISLKGAKKVAIEVNSE